jgi:hypothetical protein
MQPEEKEMKKWFLHYQRFDASIDLYCARLSGNKALAQRAISLIATIDRELDLLSVAAR